MKSHMKENVLIKETEKRNSVFSTQLLYLG